MTDSQKQIAAAGTSWADYRFPAWVPAQVQDLVRDFWRAEWGRSPQRWLEGAAASYNHHPPLGSLVEAQSNTSSGKPLLRGRWVPLWNNIGCVVFEDGSHRGSSTCGIRVLDDDGTSGAAA